MSYPTCEPESGDAELISGSTPDISGLAYVIHDGVATVTAFVGEPRHGFLVVKWNGADAVSIEHNGDINTVSGDPITLNSVQEFVVFIYANGVFWESGRLGDPIGLSVLDDPDQLGDGIEVDFTFAGGAGLTEEQIEIYADGLRQSSNDYTAADSGADVVVTFNVAPADGVKLHFHAYV